MINRVMCICTCVQVHALIFVHNSLLRQIPQLDLLVDITRGLSVEIHMSSTQQHLVMFIRVFIHYLDQEEV